MDVRSSVSIALVQVANSSPAVFTLIALNRRFKVDLLGTRPRHTRKANAYQYRHHERITQKVTHAMTARWRMCGHPKPNTHFALTRPFALLSGLPWVMKT